MEQTITVEKSASVLARATLFSCEGGRVEGYGVPLKARGDMELWGGDFIAEAVGRSPGWSLGVFS